MVFLVFDAFSILSSRSDNDLYFSHRRGFMFDDIFSSIKKGSQLSLTLCVEGTGATNYILYLLSWRYLVPTATLLVFIV